MMGRIKTICCTDYIGLLTAFWGPFSPCTSIRRFVFIASTKQQSRRPAIPYTSINATRDIFVCMCMCVYIRINIYILRNIICARCVCVAVLLFYVGIRIEANDNICVHSAPVYLRARC